MTDRYTLVWLSEEGPDTRTDGLTLADAFELMMRSTSLEHSFEHVAGVMVLMVDDEPYRTMSRNPDDATARDEIRRAAIAHCWGDYCIELDAPPQRAEQIAA